MTKDFKHISYLIRNDNYLEAVLLFDKFDNFHRGLCVSYLAEYVTDELRTSILMQCWFRYCSTGKHHEITVLHHEKLVQQNININKNDAIQ